MRDSRIDARGRIGALIAAALALAACAAPPTPAPGPDAASAVHVVRPGDTVEVAAKAKEQLRVKGAVTAAETRGFPEWIEVDAKEMKGKFKALPARSELPSTINESLVVELYSK